MTGWGKEGERRRLKWQSNRKNPGVHTRMRDIIEKEENVDNYMTTLSGNSIKRLVDLHDEMKWYVCPTWISNGEGVNRPCCSKGIIIGHQLSRAIKQDGKIMGRSFDEFPLNQSLNYTWKQEIILIREKIRISIPLFHFFLLVARLTTAGPHRFSDDWSNLSFDKTECSNTLYGSQCIPIMHRENNSDSSKWKIDNSLLISTSIDSLELDQCMWEIELLTPQMKPFSLARSPNNI